MWAIIRLPYFFKIALFFLFKITFYTFLKRRTDWFIKPACTVVVLITLIISFIIHLLFWILKLNFIIHIIFIHLTNTQISFSNLKITMIINIHQYDRFNTTFPSVITKCFSERMATNMGNIYFLANLI